MTKEKPFHFNKFYDLQNQTAFLICHFREGGNPFIPIYEPPNILQFESCL